MEASMARDEPITCIEAQGLRELQADLKQRSSVIFRVSGESFDQFSKRIAAEYGARLYQVQIELEPFQDR
jgi:hypothetical protein